MHRVFLILLAACAMFGQETPLTRLKREAARMKALPKEDAKEDSKIDRSLTALHVAFRDWIESRLPADRGMLEIQSGHLEFDLRSELEKAELAIPASGAPDSDPFEFPGLGYLNIEFRRLPELPDTLFVVAGASVPCGTDQAIYMYHFDAATRKRILADHPKADGYGYAQLELSDPDPQGRRLLLIHRLSQQCASTWMDMSYAVYRLAFLPGDAERLFSGDHGLWLGNDGPEFVLKPEELIMEFLDSSVDVAIHNRTQIHRYNFSEGFRRLDPVALQPQDFVEEWLTRPWSEMKSRSAAETEEWHAKLHGDFIFGDYTGVAPCGERPGRWMIALNITDIGEKKLAGELETTFVVRDLGNYRYAMESVNEAEPKGCPTERLNASEKHPWLSAAELKSLR